MTKKNITNFATTKKQQRPPSKTRQHSRTHVFTYLFIVWRANLSDELWWCAVRFWYTTMMPCGGSTSLKSFTLKIARLACPSRSHRHNACGTKQKKKAFVTFVCGTAVSLLAPCEQQMASTTTSATTLRDASTPSSRHRATYSKTLQWHVNQLTPHYNTTKTLPVFRRTANTKRKPTITHPTPPPPRPVM